MSNTQRVFHPVSKHLEVGKKNLAALVFQPTSYFWELDDTSLRLICYISILIVEFHGP